MNYLSYSDGVLSLAITFHRQKRSKRTVKTELTDIEGVGPKTAQKLLNLLGSVKVIKKTPKEKLQDMIGNKTGKKVFQYFNEP